MTVWVHVGENLGLICVRARVCIECMIERVGKEVGEGNQ